MPLAEPFSASRARWTGAKAPSNKSCKRICKSDMRGFDADQFFYCFKTKTFRTLTRRNLLQAGCAAMASPLFFNKAFAVERSFAPKVEGWRSFEVSTTITLPEANGVSRIWLPVPDVNGDY
jgi:hypothetical protein